MARDDYELGQVMPEMPRANKMPGRQQAIIEEAASRLNRCEREFLSFVMGMEATDDSPYVPTPGVNYDPLSDAEKALLRKAFTAGWRRAVQTMHEALYHV